MAVLNPAGIYREMYWTGPWIMFGNNCRPSNDLDVTEELMGMKTLWNGVHR